MPVEVELNIENCVKSQQKEYLNELRGLIKSLAKVGTNPDCEVFKVLVKRFIYTVTCIPDNYFLSDVCENVYELFLEFRILLGYFEKGQTGSDRFRKAFDEILEISSEIYEMFKGFLSDPGYKGTNFPKPGKLKSMRELGFIVKDAKEVLLLSKMKCTVPKRIDHFSIDMMNTSNHLIPPSAKDNFKNLNFSVFHFNEEPEMIQLEGNILINQSYDKILSSPNESTNSSSTSSSSSVCSESNLLKSYQTPLAPILFHKDLNSEGERRKSTGSLVDSLLLPDRKRDYNSASMTMNAPNPPTSNHGRIPYVPVSTEQEIENVPVRRCKSVVTIPKRTGNLRPPVLVDDDGDILPTGPIPQLRSAATSIYENCEGIILTMDSTDDQENVEHELNSNSNIYSNNSAKVIEDDDSFIMAYRNRNRSIESEKKELEPEEYNNFNNNSTRNDSPNPSKIKTMEDFELSGWSQKNRS